MAAGRRHSKETDDWSFPLMHRETFILAAMLSPSVLLLKTEINTDSQRHLSVLLPQKNAVILLWVP